jgi:hypothetical protein
MKKEKDYVKNLKLLFSLGTECLRCTSTSKGGGDEAPRVLKLGARRTWWSDLQSDSCVVWKGAPVIHCIGGSWVPQLTWTGLQTEKQENAWSHS